MPDYKAETPLSWEPLMPRQYLVPVTEHVNSFEGDWQQALMGVIQRSCPVAEVVGNRIYAARRRPSINVFLPDDLDESQALEEVKRLGAQVDEFIKRARGGAALSAMAAMEAPPLRPDGLPPPKKGALLVEYVRAGVAVDGLDFSRANVPPGTDLARANLKGGRLLQALLEQVNLEGADLRGADLRHARLAGANLSGTLLHEADLRHARLERAHLAGAQLHRVRADNVWLEEADLSAADLQGCDFRHAALRAARFDNAVLTGVLLDADACRRAGWTDGQVIDLRVTRGVRLDSLDEFPPGVRSAFSGTAGGLTLTFDTRLHRFDATAFDALILEILGPDTDVTIEERSNIDAQGPAFIRINGSRSDDLAKVAEAFYDRAWQSTEGEVEKRAVAKALSSGVAIILHRLDEMRAAWTDAAINHPDVQEMLLDQAEAHVTTKIAAETRAHGKFRRIADAIRSEAKSRATALIGEQVVDAVVDAGAEAVEDVAGWKDQRDQADWDRKMDADDERRLLEGPSDDDVDG